MKKATPWIVLLVILGGIAAWYFSGLKTAEDHPSVVSLPPSQVSQPEPKATFPVEQIPVQDPELTLPLPALGESDQELTERLATLVGAEVLGTYFVLEQIINRIVATVDSLDSRQLAPLVMPLKPASGKFRTIGGEIWRIHPANAQRYSPYVRIAASVDTARVMDLYVSYYPLFQEAYADLGHGDVYFNDRLIEIIDHLLATPEPEGALLLIKPEAVYLFAVPELEALSAGQKLMLRVGSSNSAVVMDKLLEIRAALTSQR